MTETSPVPFQIFVDNPVEKCCETVCAWAIAKPETEKSGDEIRNFCKGQIAHFNIPKHVRIITDLPMTITGKPQKLVMRDQMVDLLATDN
jgi:fatty-acyl-CoA synthase